MSISDFISSTLASSGKIARKYYRANTKTEVKSDKSLVTIADEEIEDFIRNEIALEYPDVAISGEEKGSNAIGADKYFVIDPIDGTSSFLAGRATFGIMIAYVENGTVIASGVHQPITNETWLGTKGKPATLNGEVIKARSIDKLQDALIATTSTFLLDEFGQTAFSQIAKHSRQTIMGGDCYNYCLLANGGLHVVIEQNLKPHDYLPLIPIVEGAGGIISDWTGNSVKANHSTQNVIACSSKKLLEDIVKIISRLEDMEIS